MFHSVLNNLVVSIRISILIASFLCLSALGMAQEGKTPLRLSLADALQRADTLNLHVMMASARIEGAIARLAEARSDIWPHVEGTLNAGRQTSDLRAQGLTLSGLSAHQGPYNNFNARPRLTINLFDASAFERLQAARKSENLSKTDLEKTREDVLALVANLFVDAKRRSQAVALWHTLLKKDQMAYHLSETGFAQGTGSALDVNKLRADLDQTQYVYKQAEVQALEARLDLASALQLSLDQPLELVDDGNFLQALTNSVQSQHSLKNNTDVVMADSALALDLAEQKVAKADFLPKITGAADYGRLGESLSHGSNTYFVGVQVSVPIWEGGAQQAKLKETKANVKEAQENLQDTKNQAQVSLYSARAVIIEADDLILAATDQKDTAQKSLDIALHAQEIGSGSVFDVMKAKSDLAESQDAYNEAQATWVMSHINLLHAEGRLRDLVKM